MRTLIEHLARHHEAAATHPAAWLEAARALPRLGLFCALTALLAAGAPTRAAASGWTAAYIGTYTEGKSKGIYLCRFDERDGSLSAPELVAETASPSFLAISPDHRFLYAANEISSFGGKRAGAVSAFVIDPSSGKLSLLNQETSGGPGPCHLSLDRSGRHVFVANYGGGSIEVLPVRPDGGLEAPSIFIQHKRPGQPSGRQEGPHAHFILPDPSGRHILAADLGLNQVFIYNYDAKKGLADETPVSAAELAPGSGPRHFAYGRGARFLYVVNELNSTVTVFKYDGRRGTAELVEALSTLPAGFSGERSCAEIAMHPSGRFLYASNRGHDSIAIFSVAKSGGRLTLLGNQSTRGRTPRSFEIDPSGRWLVAANQSSNDLAIFLIDSETGLLTPKGPLVGAGAPVCVKFLPMK